MLGSLANPLAVMQEDVSDQIYLFVCCHGSRDRRCGVIGPPLCAALEQHIAKVGLEGKAHVRMCSHIGGHKVSLCTSPFHAIL